VVDQGQDHGNLSGILSRIPLDSSAIGAAAMIFWRPSRTMRLRWLDRWRTARARGRIVRRFDDEVRRACDARELAAVEPLARRRAELGLTEDEAAIALEMLDALRELAELAARLDRGDPPTVETRHRVLGGDVCYFVAPVSLPDRDAEASGKLFLTDRRIVWVGGPAGAALAWTAAGLVRRDDRDIVVVSVDRQRVYRFRCNSYADAMRGAYIAERQMARRRRSSGIVDN
jgi:hypothetical protein